MHIILILIIFVFSACQKELSEFDLLNKKNPIGEYGNDINLQEFKQIKKLLDNPDEYLNSNVLISGKILEVCPMRGCWIIVQDIDSNSNIRVKVTDGEIVFPLSSKGKQVDVQGTFVKLEFSEDQAKRWKIHLAEEQGIKLSEEDVVINPLDLIEYRIIGQAANIYNIR
tara:strand:+ start:766 stop:1272 length:507 start_codon:yes stop_codon:yes gene_type:complete